VSLASFGRESYCSQSAMAKLLKTVEEEGLPDAFSRASQYRARKALCGARTPYGPLVTAKDAVLNNGASMQVGVQCPLAFLHYHCENSPHYAKAVVDALETYPCGPATPWHIIMYQDGVDPGDGLAKNKSRKLTVFYWAFLELGMSALAHEQVWGTSTVMRTSCANKLEGGIVQLTEIVLDSFFGAPHDIMRAGVTVPIHGTQRRVTLFAVVGAMLADEPAMKEMLSCKGHAGTKPCLLCQNATNAKPSNGTPLHLFGCGYAKPITDRDWAGFVFHTDATMLQTVRKLHGYKDTLAPNAFELREQVLGFTWNPRNVLLNERFKLKGASIVMYDWAHVYVSDGIADGEFSLCMKYLHKARARASFAELGTYLVGWTWPKARGSPMHLFESKNYKKYVKKGGSFGSTASEFLSLTSVLHRYFSRVALPRGECVDQVKSMIAVLDVLELLQAVKVGGHVRPDHLHVAIQAHLDLLVVAYGHKTQRPKHHYAQHLPGILSNFGVLLSTLTHERKHRCVKRYSRGRTNLQSYELGILEDVTCHQIWEMQLPFMHAFSTSTPKGRTMHALAELFPGVDVERLTLHQQISVDGGNVKNGDVISFRLADDVLQFGELLLTVGVSAESSQLYSFVTEWRYDASSAARLADRTCEHFVVCQDSTRMLPTEAIVGVHTYNMSKSRATCMVLLPYQYRRVA
jgi:hypothetical protein